jgi:anaerobic magnesium-protoporphyrin IX monomethyl ester cyclase
MANLCLIRPAEGVSPGALTSTVPTLPLGVAYLAATVREAGHRVQVIDAVGEAVDQVLERGPLCWIGLGNPEIVERIRPDTDVLGVSIMFSHNWPLVRELLALLRAAFPGVPILVGGESATALPELVLCDSPADVVVMGEGEETLLELLEVYEADRSPAAVAGIAHRGPDGAPCRTPRRNRIREIDAIPWPAWDLFDVRAYAERNFTMGLQIEDTPPALPLLATRGCPYQCTFCTSPRMWTTAYETRDPRDVVDEIASYVRDYGVRNFPFQDLTAIIKKDWIVAFCRELLDRGLDIHWQLPAGTRSEAVDAEVAELLQRTGMAHMAYAPEAGSLRVRKAVKKRVVAERFFQSVEAACAAGLHVQVFFVMGFPEEETRDLRATLGMIAKLAWMGVEDVAVSHYMPYPGSEMYDDLLECGKVDQSDTWLTAPIQTHGMLIPRAVQVNENFGALSQSLHVLAGFALFYGISAVRKPGYFLRMLWGLFFDTGHDVSRLQRALKGMLRTKKVYPASAERRRAPLEGRPGAP